MLHYGNSDRCKITAERSAVIFTLVRPAAHVSNRCKSRIRLVMGTIISESRIVRRAAVSFPSKLTRGLGIDFSEGYELGISDNEEDVVETVEDWMTRLRNQVTAFAQTPVEVEIARPEFPSVDYSAEASGISGNTFMVPIKAELELGMEPYMREVSRQNTLLEEQNRLLKDIREKPVIQDSDVFSSYQRSQQNYFARTGRVGISGID